MLQDISGISSEASVSRVSDPNSAKMTTMQTKYQEDAGVYEIFYPLAIRWKLLAGGVLAGMILAAVATSFMPKQYETHLLLSIGIAVDKNLEDPYTVTKIMNTEAYQQATAAKVGLNFPPKRLQKMIQAETDTGNRVPWVSVRVTEENPQTAVKLANALADGMIQRHAVIFNEKMQRYKDYKVELERNIAEFSKETEILKGNLTTYRSGPHDLSAEMMLQTRLTDKENQIITFNRELRDLSTLLTNAHSRKTSLLAAPVLPTSPEKPSLKLNVIIAAVGSLFLMISFVLLREQYRKGSLGI